MAAWQVRLRRADHHDRDRQEAKRSDRAALFLQAETSSFQDLLTAASPTLPACSLTQDTVFDGLGLCSGSSLDAALLLDLERQIHDWTDAACQTDIAEPTDANLPAATTSNSPEWFLDPASTSSGHPAAVHQHHRTPVPGIKQNVQQSGCHGRSAGGPQMRVPLNLSASTQPARRSYLAHLADPGPTPKPAICTPMEGQVSIINAYAPPELSLPRSSLDQPAGWRISATHSPHQPCTAARICPTTQVGDAPLPGMPIGASLNAAQPSAISGG